MDKDKAIKKDTEEPKVVIIDKPVVTTTEIPEGTVIVDEVEQK